MSKSMVDPMAKDIFVRAAKMLRDLKWDEISPEMQEVYLNWFFRARKYFFAHGLEKFWWVLVGINIGLNHSAIVHGLGLDS